MSTDPISGRMTRLRRWANSRKHRGTETASDVHVLLNELRELRDRAR